MKKQKKGLQKFTEPGNVLAIFEKARITQADLDLITDPNDKALLSKEFNRRLAEFEGIEREKFLKQVDEILTEETKNNIWENNHLSITQYLNQYLCDYGQMPNKTIIARGTGLSRATIHKHFKEYQNSEIYKEQNGQFKIMRDKVIAMVFQIAKQGDIKACRLFLEVTAEGMGGVSGQRFVSTTNTQNNYIQINNLKIDQEQIKNLSPQQIAIVEKVFKNR